MTVLLGNKDITYFYGQEVTNNTEGRYDMLHAKCFMRNAKCFM